MQKQLEQRLLSARGKLRYTHSLIADSKSVVKPLCAVAISDIFLSCANFFTDSVCVAMSMCIRSLRCSLEKWRALPSLRTVSYTHLRAHETPEHLVCRLLLEKNIPTL